MTNSTSSPLEQSLFVIEFSAMIETDIHVSGVYGDVNYAIFESIARSITQGHRAISVINVFGAWRHLFQHEGASEKRQVPNWGIKRCQKLQKRLGRRVPHACTWYMQNDVEVQQAGV